MNKKILFIFFYFFLISKAFYHFIPISENTFKPVIVNKQNIVNPPEISILLFAFFTSSLSIQQRQLVEYLNPIHTIISVQIPKTTHKTVTISFIVTITPHPFYSKKQHNNPTIILLCMFIFLLALSTGFTSP